MTDKAIEAAAKHRINSGYLYLVKKQMITNAKKGKRRAVIEEGEIVEFRFYHPANFRTIENEYFAVDEDVFENSVVPYAEILEVIRSRNKNTLKQILDAELYKRLPTIPKGDE